MLAFSLIIGHRGSDGQHFLFVSFFNDSKVEPSFQYKVFGLLSISSLMLCLFCDLLYSSVERNEPFLSLQRRHIQFGSVQSSPVSF